jgi:hypothetical protein
MSRYSRHNPDEPIRHDWLSGSTSDQRKAHSLDRLVSTEEQNEEPSETNTGNQNERESGTADIPE